MPRGSIRQRSKVRKDSWTDQVYMGVDPETGKKRYHSETIKGAKYQAQRRLTELLRQVDTATFVEPSKLTVGEYLRQWLRDYAKTHVRQRTLEGYRERLEKHVIPHVGHIALDKLSPRQIQGLETTLLKSGRRDGAGGLSAQTVLNVHRVLFQALRHALRLGLLQRNPAEAVEPPRASRYQARTMDWDGVQEFLEAAHGSPYYPLFILALHTGLRRSELLGLKWKDVSCENGTVAVTQAVVRVPRKGRVVSAPKSGRARVVALPPEAILVFQHHRAKQEARAVQCEVPTLRSDGFVFPGANGSPVVSRSRLWGIQEGRRQGRTEGYTFPRLASHPCFSAAVRGSTLEGGVGAPGPFRGWDHRRPILSCDAQSTA